MSFSRKLMLLYCRKVIDEVVNILSNCMIVSLTTEWPTRTVDCWPRSNQLHVVHVIDIVRRNMANISSSRYLNHIYYHCPLHCCYLWLDVRLVHCCCSLAQSPLITDNWWFSYWVSASSLTPTLPPLTQSHCSDFISSENLIIPSAMLH